MKKTNLILILALLTLTSFGLHARGPAVEPVTGISIDDYKEIPPEQAKGYDFQKGKPKAIAKKAHSESSIAPTKPVVTKTEKQIYSEGPSWPISIFLILLVALPFGAWFGVLKGLSSEETTEEAPSNTIAFPSKRTDEDDTNWPKAG